MIIRLVFTQITKHNHTESITISMEIIINTMETTMVNNTIMELIKMTNSHINTKEPLNLEIVNMPGRISYLF